MSPTLAAAVEASWSRSALVDERGVRRRLLRIRLAPGAEPARAYVLLDGAGAELDREPAPPDPRGSSRPFGFWVPEASAGSGAFVLRIERASGSSTHRLSPGRPGEGDRWPLRLDLTGEALRRRLESRERVPPARLLDPRAPSLERLLGRHSVVYERPASHWSEGLPLGNGRLGALLTGLRGRRQRIDLDACSLWAATPEGRPLGRIFAGALELCYRADGPCSQRLDLLDAAVLGTDGGLSTRARVHANRDVLELDLAWAGGEPLELELCLSRDAVPLVEGRNALMSRANGSWSAIGGEREAAQARELWRSAPCSVVSAASGGRAARIRHVLPNLEYALGAVVEGAAATWRPETLPRSACARARLTLDPGARASVRVGFAARAGSAWDADAAPGAGDLAAAAESIAAARDTAGAEDGHRAWWRDYWSRSLVELPDPLMENLWYLGVYHQACFSRSLCAPGFFGLWHPLDYRTWDDAYVADAQIELMWWAPFASGHLELLLPSHNTFGRLLAEFLEHGPPGGAMVPHSFFPAWAGGHAAFGQPNPYKGSVAWSAMAFYWDYLHTGDRELLAAVGYPTIAACADYHASELEEGDDGRLHSDHSGSPEQSNTARDNSYDRACIEAVLRAACAAAEALGGDEARLARWRECLRRLYPFPTDGRSIVECPDNRHPYRCHPTVLFGVHPTGCIEPGDPLWDAAKETYATVTNLFGFHFEDRHEPIPGHEGGVEPNGHATAFLMHAAARLWGWPEVRRLFHALAVRTQLKRNGLRSICDPRHSPELRTMAITEATSGQTSGMSEALLQDYVGHVRVFPSCGGQGRFRFAGLRSRGGFVLAAECEDGSVGSVTVHSLRGGVFRMASPWPGSPGLERSPLADGGEALVLRTEPGSTHRFFRGRGGEVRCLRVELASVSEAAGEAETRASPREARVGDWDDFDPPVLYYPEDPAPGQGSGGRTVYLGMPATEPPPERDGAAVARAFGLAASEDWRARATAARWLGRTAAPEATEALRRLAEDAVPVVAYIAGVSLVRQGTPASREAASALAARTDLPHRAREIRKAAARTGASLP